MSKVIKFDSWREQKARAEDAAGKRQRDQRSATFDRRAALQRTWREGRELLGTPEVSTYLTIPLRTLEKAIEEIEAKRAQYAERK
jgi:hypothetical protein